MIPPQHALTRSFKPQEWDNVTWAQYVKLGVVLFSLANRCKYKYKYNNCRFEMEQVAVDKFIKSFKFEIDNRCCKIVGLPSKELAFWGSNNSLRRKHCRKCHGSM